ncbi:hypothetical protein ABIB62_000533 [Mucilaginibacter sp. UYP25]
MRDLIIKYYAKIPVNSRDFLFISISTRNNEVNPIPEVQIHYSILNGRVIG